MKHRVTKAGHFTAEGSNYGGVREGAGRPKIGNGRSVKLTMHPSVWAAIDYDLEAFGGEMKLADLLRAVITEAYWDKMELLGLELPLYPNNKPPFK